MSWLVSFLWQNGLQVLLVLLLIAGMAVVGWFFQNWKIVVLAGSIAAVVIGASVLDKRAYERRSQEIIAEMVRVAERRDQIIHDLEAADDKQRQQDAAEIARLRELIDQAPTNSDACGDEDFADRVGDVR